MTRLAERANAIPWLTNVGHDISLPEHVVRPPYEAWQRFIKARAEHGLGVGQAIATGLDNFAWLSEDGPNPSQAALNRTDPSSTPGLREERLRLSALVLAGLREIPAGPWLVLGPVDLRGAVRKSAVHAFRMAAGEAHHAVAGFWHRVIALYEQGVWPAAVDPNETILVV